jgi:glycosyltransferase involved in cell wall biosynthesis
MKRIDQFVHTLAYGDAISSEVLTIHRLLNELGFESGIFAANKDHRYKEIARDHESFQEQEGAAVILHYSIASPLNELYLRCNSSRRGIIYHNLTPERWFVGYNSRVVEDLRVARAGLEAVVRTADLVLGDSTYNLEELKEFSPKNPRVFPLVLDGKKWEIEANRGIASILKSHAGVNLLSVGRVAPNKCLQDIIKAFYFYHHKINRKSRLWLVGSDTDTEIYSFELRELIDHLQLKESVVLTGAVADSELKSFYQNSDLYLCMSEHEGFCVPLIEAMNFNLPIIAFDTGAIRETLGGYGVLIPKKEPHVTAELIDLILKSERAEPDLSRYSLEAFRERLETDLIKPLVYA